MDATGLVVSTTCVAASTPLAVAAVRGYRAFSGPRFVTCPETAAEVIVKIKMTQAIASQLTGGGQLRLRSCSRWPENKNCAQSCTAQIAGSPSGCRRRALPSRPNSSPAHSWTSEHFVGMTGNPDASLNQSIRRAS